MIFVLIIEINKYKNLGKISLDFLSTMKCFIKIKQTINGYKIKMGIKPESYYCTEKNLILINLLIIFPISNFFEEHSILFIKKHSKPKPFVIFPISLKTFLIFFKNIFDTCISFIHQSKYPFLLLNHFSIDLILSWKYYQTLLLIILFIRSK